MTLETRIWRGGYASGLIRGHHDGYAEVNDEHARSRTRLDCDTTPPDELTGDETAQWIDGFLSGYRDGRTDAMQEMA